MTLDILAQLRDLKKTLGLCYADYAQQLLNVAIDEVRLDKFTDAESSISKAVDYDKSLDARALLLWPSL